jgi:hypothetical protein
MSKLKKEMALSARIELEKRENRINALLARERSERSQVELKNACLEQKVDELIEQVGQVIVDKENAQRMNAEHLLKPVVGHAGKC